MRLHTIQIRCMTSIIQLDVLEIANLDKARNLYCSQNEELSVAEKSISPLN